MKLYGLSEYSAEIESIRGRAKLWQRLINRRSRDRAMLLGSLTIANDDIAMLLDLLDGFVAVATGPQGDFGPSRVTIPEAMDMIRIMYPQAFTGEDE